MKILLVSWFFPPCNTMGALRLGKLAKYLLAEGHDVRVLCARDLPYPQTLPVEVPVERIAYTRWLDVNGLPRAAQRARRALRCAAPREPAEPAGEGGAAATGGGVLRRLAERYTTALNRPDSRIGWLPFALAGGRRVLRSWRPELIFASGPPHTTLIVGSRLARAYAVPWVAEYRDRWVEDPYYPPPEAVRARDRAWEDRIVAAARGIVTVSEPWAEDYRRRWGKPVEVVLNGFDADEFPLEAERPPGDPQLLRIVYTGGIYVGRRDPQPLFQALNLLGDAARHVRVEFYGAHPAALSGLIARHGVADRVAIMDAVPYRDSLGLQMAADVLLLLQWNDPKERGNCPGKLFEYIAARRPVLGIGLEDGVPATMLRARQAGEVVNDPARIADKLRAWIAEKRATGRIALTPPEAREGLSRAEQFRRLERFLARVLAEAGEGAAQPRASGKVRAT